MAAGSIRGNTFELKDLFGQARYDIDYYQREYAWSADDVRTLINDLCESFDRVWHDGHYRRGRGRGEPFFLGPFVYVEERRGVRFLVDGQQRFTTLHLIFLYLYRLANALNDRDTANKLNRVITDYYPGGRTRFRIDIEERWQVLEALYRDRPYEVRSGASLSVRNLWDRSQQIAELLDERLNADMCPHFVDWLLTQVVLVGIQAPSRDSGFRIFESMNDRGARLTPVDLLKSFLLSNVGGGEERLNEDWRRMLATLTTIRDDVDAPRAFLKAALLAHHAEVSHTDAADADEIDTALNIWVRKNKERLGLRRADDYFRFVEDLINLAKHYATFLHATGRPHAEHRLSALYYNEVNGLTNQMALVLAAIQPGDTPGEAKAKAALVANLLDRIYVDRVLHDEPVQSTDFEPDIHRLIPALRKCTTRHEVVEVLASEVPDDEFHPVRTFGMRGNNKAQVRYLLARITAYVETGCDRADETEKYLGEERRWQIEHLYANHPEWHTHEVPDPVTFRTLRSRLGVLVLLRRSDNASYNDLPLAEKRTLYTRENTLAAILAPGHRTRNPTLKRFVKANGVEDCFRDFGSHEPLTKVVEVRSELYRRLCTRIWAPQALGFPAKPRPTPAARPDPAISDQQPGTPRLRRRGTDVERMIRAGVLQPGTQIHSEHRGKAYTATIDEEGLIRLGSGDRFASADEAGRMVCGTKRCAGMAFWHVTLPDGRRLSLRDVRTQAQQDGRLGRTRQS